MENYTTPNQVDSNGKTTAIVSYITLIGWLIAYFAMYKDNKSSFAAYHLRQSLFLQLTAFVLSAIGMFLMAIPGMYYVIMILQIVLIILWVMGLIAAINGQEKPVPVVGGMAQSMFSGI